MNKFLQAILRHTTTVSIISAILLLLIAAALIFNPLWVCCAERYFGCVVDYFADPEYNLRHN